MSNLSLLVRWLGVCVLSAASVYGIPAIETPGASQTQGNLIVSPDNSTSTTNLTGTAVDTSIPGLPKVLTPKYQIPITQVPTPLTLAQNLAAALPNLPKALPLPVVPTKLPSAVPCTCGVFLTGQFTIGSQSQPTGNPALLQELGETLPGNTAGNKQCTNKCLDILVKHLPNSPSIICGTIDRDCHKERAYLWIKNSEDKWINTNLSAGREYCCKSGSPYKCPLVQTSPSTSSA